MTPMQTNKIEPTEAQRTKYEKFLTLPRHRELVECCQLVVEAAGLGWSEMGHRWGVTVCVSATSMLRLNVGNRVLFDALADGDMELFIVHPLDRPPAWDERIEAYEGFPQLADSIRLLLSDIDDLLDVLDEPSIPAEVKAHADASGRDLPRSEWHNPLMTGLLLPVVKDDEDDDEDDELTAGDVTGLGEAADNEDEDAANELAYLAEEAGIDPDEYGTWAEVAVAILTGSDSGSGNDDHDVPRVYRKPPAPEQEGKQMDQQVIQFKGEGTSRSRPFDIPRHAEYFTVRWQSGHKKTQVHVNGVAPTDCYESFRGAQGDGVVYETGRFYVEIESETEWDVTVEAHLPEQSPQPQAGTIETFKGTGPGKTRPFNIPKGTEYFVVRWTTTGGEMDVSVEGISPTSSYDRFSGGKNGEDLVYESGRFYAEIDTEGNWILEIIIE
jgi:hypothetical protein